MAVAVEHVNALTKRWLAEAGADGAVLSALGVWPLLAYLADGADDETGADLAAALGLPVEEAARAASELLAIVASSPSIRTALGLWTREEVGIHEDWLGRLRPGVQGRLTGHPGRDQERLDAWASERTGGLIARMPVEATPETMFVLASALSVTVAWSQEFTESRSGGPWARSAGGAPYPTLRRTTSDLDALCVADTPAGQVTAVTVEGDADVDVVLVLGPADRSPSEVLALGAEMVGVPRHPMTRGTDLPVGEAGPGVRVGMVESVRPHDSLEVTTVPFRITAHHDLLKNAELFGLQRAMSGGARGGRFPGVSDFPLCVQQAVQDAVAEFSATGFQAAAVTAIAMFGAAMILPERHRVRHVAVTFDRPFAYYAVHRDSGLILVAGWVAEPSR